MDRTSRWPRARPSTLEYGEPMLSINGASALRAPEPVTLRELRTDSGRTLRATPVFDTFWRFAHARQDLFMRRVRGEPPPWTRDKVLAEHRFTNVYRASDRVSQYLIRHVIYAGDQDPQEVFFRAMLFKLF